MALATGQFTIVDHNDATTLTGFISSNQSKTQGYSPDSGVYTPDYTVNNLILKASMFKAGSSSDLLDSGALVSNMQWYTNDNGDWTAVSGATTRQLTVDTNLPTGVNYREYRFSCKYNDEATGLALDFNATIEIVKVMNGSGVGDAVITAPEGNIFKNGNASSLKAECQLWLGSNVSSSLATSDFKWFKQESGGAGNTNWDVPTGWTEVKNHVWSADKKASVLTVSADDVLNVQVFMCVVIDPSTQTKYKDTITFVDQTDPIQVTIHSTGGSIFKNGNGETDMTAKLYQNGSEIDAEGSKYTYTWRKYDKDGALVSSFSKTGKTIRVDHTMVDSKATFIVEIS